MAIALASSGSIYSSALATTLDLGNGSSTWALASATSGNLLVVVCAGALTGTGLSASSLTKIGGTATLGTITQDKEGGNTSGSATYVYVYSAPITGSGTLQLRLADISSSGYMSGACMEFSSADTGASRVAATNGTGGQDTSAPYEAHSGDCVSGAAGVFVGVSGWSNAGGGTQAPDAAFTEVHDNYTLYASAMTIHSGYRVVTSDTTDEWLTTYSTADPIYEVCCVVYKQATGGGGRNPVSMGFDLR